jgi:four helix bundle protein
MNTDIKAKSRQFALKVMQLCKNLSANKKETILSGQLLQAGAGIGADLAKADFAISKIELLEKVHEALQGCAETKYWLELLNEGDFLTEFEFNKILAECSELGKLLLATVKTLRAGTAPQK